MGGLRDLWRAGTRRLNALPLASWRGVRTGFIVSTGRTGTQRLAEVIRSSMEGVEALHEPPPDLFHLGEAVARGSLSIEEASDELRRARQPVRNRLKRSGVLAYVESNTNAGYLPDAIRSVFDSPRFVHIVRDGRAVVRSLYSKTNPSRRPGRTEAFFMDHDDSRCRLAAVDFPDDPWSSRWLDMSRFERICWHWAKKNALIREALTPYSDALVLKFEDIFHAGTGFGDFWKMIDFLGLGDRVVRARSEVHDLLSTPSNRAADYALPPPDEWDAGLRETFERIAGAEQSKYYR